MVSFPGFRITDTYQGYKSRERTFTSWLRATGETLGLKLKQPAPRDERIEPAKHDVSISEIQRLVNLCVQNNQPLPDELRQNLKDVVRQRKEAAGFYKAKGDSKADEGHAYYMQVLQWALERFSNAKPVVPPLDLASPKGSHNAEEESTKIANSFQLLEVEDVADPGALNICGPENTEKDAPQKSRKLSSRVTTKKGKAKRNKWSKKSTSAALHVESQKSLIPARQEEAYDGEDYEEECFMVYCFFRDWNSMRDYIQERWCDYQDGILSLEIVSVITNTAFDLLQRSEGQLLEQLPRNSCFRDFRSMSEMLFFDGGLVHVDYDAQNKNSKNHENVGEDLYEEANWVCLGVYWDLMEWLAFAPPKKVPVISPMWKGDPMEYHGQSGEVNFRRDRRILFELIGECCLLKALELNPDFMIPAKDEWTQGIIKMLATRQIPIWLVFASQTMCDIRYILETGVTKCHDELLFTGQRSQNILNNYKHFARDFEMPTSPILETTLGEIDCWVTSDFTAPQRQTLHKTHQIPEKVYEDFFYLRRQPLLCGLMKFRFTLTMNELGLANSNQWGSTIATTHLYNALRHERPSVPRWPDMEALIFIHTNIRIFRSDCPPCEPSQYVHSYDQATAVSEMMAQRHLSRSKSRGTIRPANMHEYGITPVAILSMQFRQRFCFARRNKVESLPSIERVLNASAQREIESSLAGLRHLEDAGSQEPSSSSLEMTENNVSMYRPVVDYTSLRALTAQFAQTGMLTNIELLDALCTRLTQEANSLNFDYFSFHITCMRLLKSVYDEFEKDIVEIEGPLDWGCGELPIIPYRIFQWMTEDETRRSGVSDRLEKVMKPVIERDGSVELRSLQTFLGGANATRWREMEKAAIKDT